MKKIFLTFLILLTAHFSWATVRSFDGTNDEIDMGAVLDIGSADVSVCAWVLLTEDATADIIGGKKADLTFDTAGYLLYQDTVDVAQWVVCDSSAGVACSQANGTTDLDGAWHWVCGTHSFTLQSSRIYVDGVLQDTDQNTMGASLTNASEFAVGEAGDETGDMSGLSGYTHQYTGVLSPTHINELMWKPGTIVQTQTSTVTAATNGGTFANDAAVGTIAWANASNATTSNDSRATATLLLGETSNYLKVTNFGFAIPVDATIERIKVEFEAQATVLNSVDDSRVSIVKSDGTVGTTNLASVTDWPTTDTYREYATGDLELLWGETWTAADINDTDFGVVISAVDILSSAVAGVDHVRTTIYYSAGTAGTLGGYWPMWGDSTEQDLSGNNFDGTVSNASTNAGGPPVMIGDAPL